MHGWPNFLTHGALLLFIAKLQANLISFVSFPLASGSGLNFNISKLVYCINCYHVQFSIRIVQLVKKFPNTWQDVTKSFNLVLLQFDSQIKLILSIATFLNWVPLNSRGALLSGYKIYRKKLCWLIHKLFPYSTVSLPTPSKSKLGLVQHKLLEGCLHELYTCK